MGDKCVYNCEVCGSQKEMPAGDLSVPECCGQAMSKVGEVSGCKLTTTAEHARLDGFGDPCDDGRAGKV